MSGFTGPANPIIASGFYSNGKDIIGTFQQFVVGPKTAPTGVSINGTDIANFFAPYYNGPQTENVSGFMFNGGDLQSGFSPPYALSGGTTGTYIMPLVPSSLAIVSCNLNTSPATVTFTAPTIPNSISPSTSTYTYKYYVNGSATGTAGTVASSTKVNLTGMSLSAGTSYTIKVTAVNAVGESPLSSATSTTAWTVPSVPTVTSGSGSASSISFNFTKSSGTVTTYTAYYSTSNIFSTSYSNVSVANNVTSATISSGIATGSSYYVFLVANNLGGSSSNSAGYGPIVTLTAPAAPTGLTQTNYFSSGISISFTASSGTVSGYNIYYSTSNSYSGNFYTTTTSTSLNIFGLAASTYYYIFITASNAAGTSGYSSILSTYTMANNITNLASLGSTSSSISFSWSASSPAGNVPIRYDYYYGTSSGSLSYTGSTTSTSAGIGGLSASTTYYVGVNAVTGSYGTSLNTISITTQTNCPAPSNPGFSMSGNRSSIYISGTYFSGYSYYFELRSNSNLTFTVSAGPAGGYSSASSFTFTGSFSGGYTAYVSVYSNCGSGTVFSAGISV